MSDNRIDIVNLQNKRLEVIPYSDHNGIKIKIELNGLKEIIMELAIPPHTLNFNKTNWGQFYTDLIKIKPELPDNRNFTNSEIYSRIHELDQLFKDSLNNNTPAYKKINLLKDYVSPQIINLEKTKSQLLSKIHRLKKSRNKDRDEIRMYEYGLMNLKKEINRMFNLNINKYWEKRISKIKLHNYNRIFPKINRIFRNRK